MINHAQVPLYPVVLFIFSIMIIFYWITRRQVEFQLSFSNHFFDFVQKEYMQDE